MGYRGSREYVGDATVEDSSAHRQRPWEQIPIDADGTRKKRPWEQIPIEAGAVFDPAAAVEETQEPTRTQGINEIRATDDRAADEIRASDDRATGQIRASDETSRKAAVAALRELAIGDVA